MPLPASTPPAPYAYVVEYRALDACFPPACAVKSRDVFGYAGELQPDGERGAYVQYGKHDDVFYEMFFHRGKILDPQKSISFDLPANDAESELDVYIGAENENDAYQASIEFSAIENSAPPRVIESHPVNGFTEFLAPPKLTAEYGHERRVTAHVRLPLPSRDNRLVRVTITNTGATGIGVQNPLVMKRVEGRGARQALWAIYDAVPYSLFDGILRGPTHDPQTEWLHEYVAKNGIYFPNGLSPGLLTTSYARRVFRGDFYNDVGEPLLSDDLDEAPPEIAHNVISSLADQGVQTFAFLCNFAIIPSYSYLGWDGGYDQEQADHPYAVAARYEEWVREHPYDDAFVVWWIASTHLPWPSTRKIASPPPLPEGFPPQQLNGYVMQPTWANALAATDRVKEMFDAAHAANPNASRMTYLSADHGRGFSMRFENRAFRSPVTGSWPGGGSHGFAGSNEEQHTPFAIMYEGPENKPNPSPRIDNVDTPVLAALRAVENFFHVDLALPDTREFDSPAFSSADAFAARWDDDFIAGLGSDRVFRFVRGHYAYTEFTPRFDTVNIWEKMPAIQRMLAGTPYRSGKFLAEELYDRKKDPFEFTNIAGDHPDVVLDLRRRATDWLATYYGDEARSRHRYTLTFPEKTSVTITAPRPFDAWVDGIRVRMQSPRSMSVNAIKIEIQEKADAVGVIEIAGLDKPITMRCAANGLPVDATDAARPRLNLALGRENCPIAVNAHVATMKDSVMFSVERARDDRGSGEPNAARGASGLIDEKELMAGMKKWGYVRDTDDKKP